MIHLAWPWMLGLLPLPWVVYRLRSAAPTGGAALFLPFSALILPQPRAAASARLRVAALCFLLIWLLLIAAATRPQWLGPPVPVPSTARQVMLAVDVSGSMATPDMGGGQTRLQAVKKVAGSFIDSRHGDQVGLILFGTQPYLQAPLSTDLATIHQFLDEAVVGVAGPQTAIGDAIGLAIKRLRAERVAQSMAGSADPATASTDATRHSILVLLTDGGNDAGVMDPLQAARLAAMLGLRVYTIGVGAPAQMGLFGLTAGNTDLDERTLKAIAAITGGRYFRATDSDALRAVYRDIDRLEPAAGAQQWLRPADEWFTWPLSLALLLSVPAVWFGARAWV